MKKLILSYIGKQGSKPVVPNLFIFMVPVDDLAESCGPL